MKPRATGPAVAVASASLEDPAAAVTALAARLQSPQLGFVLFFCASGPTLDTLGEALNAAFPGIPVCGCTSAGEITPAGYARGSITALGFSRHYFAISAELIDDQAPFTLLDAQQLVERLTQRCQQAELAPVSGHSFAMTLLDGLSSREEELLGTLNTALGRIPQFGGSAGDDERLAHTHVFLNGHFHANAAAVLLVNTPLPFHVFSSHHLQPLADKLVVTAADSQRRTVHSLNAEPAAQAYARAAGVAPQALDRTTFALHPLAVRIGETYFLRSVQRVNADQSLTFYCAVETGIVMTAMVPGDLLGDLKSRLLTAQARVGVPLVTIACDCFLRRLEAELSGTGEAVSALLQEHGVVGFNTYGEQFAGSHLNQTFTGVVIGQPQPLPRGGHHG